MLDDDDLNDMDEWLLSFLADHEWASPNLLRQMYNDDHDDVSRQWVSGRLTRLREHSHIERVHSDASEVRLVDDPREDDDE